MQQLSYEIRFLTPAFLGDAAQNGRWRTPPFKALLRQWWRVVYARDNNFEVDIKAMRHDEDMLFGHAWLDDDFTQRNGHRHRVPGRQSAIRLRLDLAEAQSSGAWTRGTQHGVGPVPTDLTTGYAWFGLVDSKSKQPLRDGIAAKPPESDRRLRIACPHAEETARLETAMRLITRFGQVGARSRGGWGSLHIKDLTALPDHELVGFSRALGDCLQHDWPMSLGRDDVGILLWHSKTSFPTWDQAMKVIAVERRAVRLALKSLHGQNLRPVLGFAQGSNRMPSPLRWRVVSKDNDQLGIDVFAMPSLIPDAAGQRIDSNDTRLAWEEVVKTLDKSNTFVPRPQHSQAEG